MKDNHLTEDLHSSQSECFLVFLALWFAADAHYLTQLIYLSDGTTSKCLQQQFQLVLTAEMVLNF